jgi:uncharacterized phage-associated protein
MSLDINKFEAMVLYFANSPVLKKNLGLTKLYKLLYFADTASLRDLGETITGSEYIKYPHGPVPSRGEKILKQMQKEALISLDTVNRGKNIIMHKVTPKKEAAAKAFSKSEIEILDSIIKKYGKMSASALSGVSHKEPAWINAGDLQKLSADLMMYGSEEDPEGL